jgi:hypothetical protein
MAVTTHKSNVASLPILNALAVTLGLTAALFLLLYWLMQPKVFENPGLASYRPPPGTRLEPLPRASDAPQLAELPESKTVAAVAQEASSSETPKPAKAEKRKLVKKQQPPVRARREHQEPASRFAQQREYREQPNRFAQQREYREWPNRFAQQTDFGFGWGRSGTW